MDSLPDDVLLQILSRLDDSADVARCRVASKAFDTVFPGLRSINLRYTSKWYNFSNSSTCHPRIKPFHTVLQHLISTLRSVELVCLSLEQRSVYHHHNNDFHHTDHTSVLPLISKYCHNLVKLKVENAYLSMHNMISLPTLTSLTLRNVSLKRKELSELNRCLPNLQTLNLEDVDVSSFEDTTFHFLNLKTCICKGFFVPSLTLIAPNLVTLSVDSHSFTEVNIEAPLLSQFHYIGYRDDAFKVMKFENLKELWLESKSFDIASLLSKFPVIKTLKTLTLDSKRQALKDQDSKLTLGMVFTIFPALTCLYIKYGTWFELEAGLSRQGCEVLDATNGLKTICAHLKLVDPLLTFSSVTCVLDQCVCLSKVSFLIHSHFVGTRSESFKSKCMDHWPGLKWRWGIWSENKKDYWIN